MHKNICRTLEQIYHKQALTEKNKCMQKKLWICSIQIYINRLLWRKHDWTLMNNIMFSSANTILQSSSNISELIRSGIMNCNENVNCCLIALYWSVQYKLVINSIASHVQLGLSIVFFKKKLLRCLRRNIHQSKLQFAYVILASVSLSRWL